MRMLNGTGVVMQSTQEGSTQSPPPPNVLGANTPVAYYQPIAITPAAIKWVAGAVIAALALMPQGFLDRYLLPAKDSELKTLQVVVETVQKQQDAFRTQMEASRDALSRLTLAVDNLSGIVTELKKVPKQAVGAVRAR